MLRAEFGMQFYGIPCVSIFTFLVRFFMGSVEIQYRFHLPGLVRYALISALQIQVFFFLIFIYALK
jgi:hypothetical protein